MHPDIEKGTSVMLIYLNDCFYHFKKHTPFHPPLERGKEGVCIIQQCI
jgi:hypothetical protein